MIYINVGTMQDMQRPVGCRLLLWCFALSVALHVAMLTLLPDYRAPRDTAAQRLIVELTTKELPQPPVIDPPRKDPEVRPVPREQPPFPKRVQPDPTSQPANEDKAPPLASAPPVLSLPSEPTATAAPATRMPPPCKRSRRD